SSWTWTTSAPPTTTAAPSTSGRTASSTSGSARTACPRTRRRSATAWARCCASTPTARSPRTTRSTTRRAAPTAPTGRWGSRNPCTFAFEPKTGRMFINDVGQSAWEEIDDGVAAANYGWPTHEGFANPPDPADRDPLYAYFHDGTICAITGGTFYDPVRSR